MLRTLQIFIIGLLVDLYLFPVALSIAPSLNFKKLMAVAGVALLALNVIKTKQYKVAKSIFFAGGLALLFSVMNLIAVEINNTMDFAYANYITTFFVWMFSAYFVTSAIRWGHKRVTIDLLSIYLLVVCTIQCILAILIDKFVVLSELVPVIFNIATDFYEKGGRLYGIGCALDPAGIRFSVVLVLTVFSIIISPRLRNNNKAIFFTLLSFGVVAVIGNMISRTTTIGLGLSLATIVMSTGMYRLQLRLKYVNVYKVFSMTMLIIIPLVIYLYQTSSYTRDLLEFGFEGFFNWINNGKWETNSTNILKNMWRWPDDLHGWLVGYGYFTYISDIAYVRFIFYTGIFPLAVFSLFFIYNGLYFTYKYRRYKYMFLIFTALTFIFWVKVATDIFFIYALFYSFVDKEESAYKPVINFR